MQGPLGWSLWSRGYSIPWVVVDGSYHDMVVQLTTLDLKLYPLHQNVNEVQKVQMQL
jgi:hypothetical protein